MDFAAEGYDFILETCANLRFPVSVIERLLIVVRHVERMHGGRIDNASAKESRHVFTIAQLISLVDVYCCDFR